MDIKKNISAFQKSFAAHQVRLIAVSKTKPNELISEAYDAGLKDFGENKVQELVSKYEALPKDIQWHMIGHLQRNKVKYIVSFVHLIHSVDSLRLLQEIDKQAAKHDRVIDCLLQIHIAREETKFGLSREELLAMLYGDPFRSLAHIRIVGLMGMATNTHDEDRVREEFRALKSLFEEVKTTIQAPNLAMKELSMGMSGDYEIALEEGSTMVRVGSAIFGPRNYAL